jgi:hypothetical protein
MAKPTSGKRETGLKCYGALKPGTSAGSLERLLTGARNGLASEDRHKGIKVVDFKKAALVAVGR